MLFIDARKLGSMLSRTQKELTRDDIARIAETYHAWRREGGDHANVQGFSASTTIDEIRQQGYVLTPGRYVGTDEGTDDGEVFEAKMKRLTASLQEHRAAVAALDMSIATNLEELGYGG